jgi:predicted O-methyltransferase YrrM
MTRNRIKCDAELVMKDLDSWVSANGNGRYIPDDFVYIDGLATMPVFTCQQVRQELFDLVNIICQQPWFLDTTGALEIGLGTYGSTHWLWRHLFDSVLTIEKQTHRVNQFSENTERYHKKFVLDDGQSRFVLGESQDPRVVKKVYDTGSRFNMLFIDGDHKYDRVMADWLLYKDLVLPGGMIVFDDVVWTQHADDGGVPRFLKDLEHGKFGVPKTTTAVVHSKSVGIAYYTV